MIKAALVILRNIHPAFYIAALSLALLAATVTIFTQMGQKARLSDLAKANARLAQQTQTKLDSCTATLASATASLDLAEQATARLQQESADATARANAALQAAARQAKVSQSLIAAARANSPVDRCDATFFNEARRNELAR